MSNALFIGLLSGSSMDAVDAALVSFENAEPKLIFTESYPIPDDFKQQCLALSQQGMGSIDEFGTLDVKAGKLFSKAVLSLLNKAKVNPKQIRAIGSHGQNLRHRPNANPPFTLQIGDPNIIAEETGILTIADFRRRDVAAGGQGAPLAPGFHAIIFGQSTKNRVVVNIGGISNITVLAKQQKIVGFDIGPGNCLMDSWVNRHWQMPFDKDGKIAQEGIIHAALLEKCLGDPYFQTTPPKSTGREYFNLEWLQTQIASLNLKQPIAPQDIQATLLALTAMSITLAIHQYAPNTEEVFICGGGAHNTLLMQTLAEKLKQPVQSTESLGISPDWVEAMLFAWLAKQTLEGKSGNCPDVTGAKHAIPLGGIFGYTAEPIIS